MAKRKFELTEQERTKLFQAYELCKDGPTRTRYQAVRLYGEGYDEKEIETDHRLLSLQTNGLVPLLPRRPFAGAG